MEGNDSFKYGSIRLGSPSEFHECLLRFAEPVFAHQLHSLYTNGILSK